MKKYVEKRAALRVLEDAASQTVQEYAESLRKAGFSVKGPRKAWNILHRLLGQGLVRRYESPATIKYVRYGLPIQREQNVIMWSITEKGVGRRKWLDKHAKSR